MTDLPSAPVSDSQIEKTDANNPLRDSSERGTANGGSGVQHVKVSEGHEGQRIDNFLMRELKGVPRTHVYRIIRRGDVRINKKRCKPDRKLMLGDEVRVPPFSGANVQEPGELSASLRSRLLNLVLLETDDYLVIDKPSGMAVHGGTGIRLGLIEAVRQVSTDWAQAELAHRLDRETSGCLLIAKNASFLKSAQNQFRAKTVEKDYLALVHGSWPSGVSKVEAPLLKDALGENERIVRVSDEGKPALTRFTAEQRFADATLMRAAPETGRTHQIRVHCQFVEHAIVGDEKYTAREIAPALRRITSLCLHAEKLAFDDLKLGKRIEVVAPLDQQFLRLLEAL